MAHPYAHSPIYNATILVVDDAPDNIVIARTALNFYGAHVYTATNGEEGIRLLQEILPTLILLDIRMPTMDGWTMFRKIRENPSLTAIPVIAVTAFAMDGDRDRILETGFNGYISKPFNLKTFVLEIETILLGRITIG